MNFPLFIARKINGNEDKGRKVSKPAIRIATLGVAIGLAVMIVSVCVVLGFKHTIRDKVVGFGSHITVANFNSFQRSENYPIVVNDSLKRALMQTQGVRHVQRYAYTQGILKTDDDFLGVMLKGVGSDFDSTFIHQNMVAGSIPAFSDVKSQQKILLSKAIAEKLDLKVGDRIYAYFVNEQGVRTRRFTISGIYETNLKQFDSQICFTDLYTTNKLNGWQTEQCSGAEVQVNDFEQLDAVALNILNKVKGTTSNDKGDFVINVAVNDTLYISFLGYKSTKVLVTNDMVKYQGLKIGMTELAYALEEVVVTPYKLTGYLDIDAKNAPINNNTRYSISGLEIGYESRASASAVGRVLNSVMNPADLLYRSFSNKGKELRKLRSMRKDNELSDALSTRYDRETLLELLKVDRAELEEIIRSCNYSNDFIMTANDLQVLEAISQCYEEYRVLHKSKEK